MGRFTKIPQDTFDALQMDAGMLLKSFNIAEAQTEGGTGFTDADIICATTGGINIVAEPTFSDLGEDVDNVPLNMMELKHLDSWSMRVTTTGLGTSPELIRMTLGVADIVGGTKIVPRRDLKQSDFSTLWWVGDKANGGFVAVEMKNMLSTAGFSLQTTKNGKGQTNIELTGHVSINAQDEMPFTYYSIDEESGTTYTYTAVSPVGTENPSEEEWYVLVGDAYRLTTDTTVDSNVTYYERSEE